MTSNTVGFQDRVGDYAVLLDMISDDHVVICFRIDKKGVEVDFTVGCDTKEWDLAVARAKCAAAFQIGVNNVYV